MGEGRDITDIDSFRNSLTSKDESVQLNVVYMTVFVAVGMPHAIRGEEELPHELWVVEHCFTLAFVLELVTRICIQKESFLLGPQKAWNMFDTALVCFQIVQSILRYYSFSILRGAAFYKLIRIFSLFRTVKDFRAFRLMVDSITWQPIFWGAVKLCGFIFVFALLITQIVQAGIMELNKVGTGIPRDVLDYFGSLWLTMGSLFLVITGGANWHHLIFALDKVTNHDLAQFIFVAYMFIMIFGVMNSINAVYIDHLLNFSEHSRFVAMSESAIRNKDSWDLLRAMFNAADLNQNGKLSYTMFSKVMRSREAAKVLHSLGIELHAAVAFFRLLEDVDNCGSVNIEEFVRSLAGLHEGSAPQLLLSTLVFRGQAQLQKISTVAKAIENHFSRAQDNMSKMEDDIISILTFCRHRRDSEIG